MKRENPIILVALSVCMQSCGSGPELYECKDKDGMKFGMSLTESELKILNKELLFDKEVGVTRYYKSGTSASESRVMFDTVTNTLYANMTGNFETFSCSEITK